MRNIKLTIAYDGTKYRGWQRQNRRTPKTIQEEMEKALQEIFQKRIVLIGSGRTDAGVHALAQAAHFKIDSQMRLDKIMAALNGVLPQDIAVLKVEEMPLGFHARFDARSKTYIYCIFPSTAKTPFVSSFAWCVRHLLDLRLMRREAKCLLGKHNFKSFQASEKTKRRSVTTIHWIYIKRVKNSKGLPISRGLELVTIEIGASGFLRNMVRNIVGTLVDMGSGRLKKGGLAKILKKQDRKSAGRCAPACGLYLADVVYGK